LVPLRCPEGGPPARNDMTDVARFHDGALFRRLPVCEAFWEVASDLAHSPVAEWAIGSFYPAELRRAFVDGLGAHAAVDLADLRRGLRRPPPRAAFGSREPPPPGSGHARAETINERGLPRHLLELLGVGNRGGKGDDVIALADAALNSVRCWRGSSRSNSSDDDDAIEEAALPARSVRCPATRGRKLVPCRGVLADLALFSEAPEQAPSSRRRDELRSMEKLLVRLARDVFRIPTRNVGIVFEVSVEGCSHARGSAKWPLLFSYALWGQIGDDPCFWLAEFCHALAHRSVGFGNCSPQHSHVAQVLLGTRHVAFLRAFPEAPKPTRHQRSRSRTHSRGHTRSCSRSHSRSQSRSRRRRRR